jgi:hypothetical protein
MATGNFDLQEISKIVSDFAFRTGGLFNNAINIYNTNAGLIHTSLALITGILVVMLVWTVILTCAWRCCRQGLNFVQMMFAIYGLFACLTDIFVSAIHVSL